MHDRTAGETGTWPPPDPWTRKPDRLALWGPVENFRLNWSVWGPLYALSHLHRRGGAR